MPINFQLNQTAACFFIYLDLAFSKNFQPNCEKVTLCSAFVLGIFDTIRLTARNLNTKTSESVFGL